MDKNKLYEKTKAVYEKNQEFQEVLDDLKNEVRDVYNRNELLNKENNKLREELELLRNQQVAPKVETPVTPVPEVAVKEEIEIVPEPTPIVEPVQEVPVPQRPIQVSEEVRIKREKAKARNSEIAEFFLGKNIIAKIASVLIFLGIVSFGQLAYEWFPDVGKVLLIVFAGVVFGVIGYFTEKRKIYVFSNVFYIIALATLFYSNTLGGFSFDLYSTSVFSYITIGLMVGTFFYFKNKRYEFLDVALMIYYVVLGLSNSFYIWDQTGVGIIELILQLATLGFIVYVYYTRYYNRNNRMRMILLPLITIPASIYMFNAYYETQATAAVEYTALIGISAILIGFVYLINFYPFKKHNDKICIVFIIGSLYTMLFGSIGLSTFIHRVFDAANFSFYPVVFALLFIPLYIHQYRKKEEPANKYSFVFISAIVFALLFYSVSATNLVSSRLLDTGVLNLIHMLTVVGLYFVAKRLKEKNYVFMTGTVLWLYLIRNIIFYLFEGRYIFEDSFVIFNGVGLGIALLLVYHLLRDRQGELDQRENITLYSFMIVMLIPLMITVTNDWISTDNAFSFMIVLLTLIGYRWLTDIKILDVQFKKYLHLGLNMLLLLITLFLNNIYFNHDFGLADHVVKFIVLFLVNVYLIYSLREVYKNFGENDNREINFILLYAVGVFIHSMFLHRYINIDFDKVILSSYFLIASAVGVLSGFRYHWKRTRLIGLGAIFFSLLKIFIYDLADADMTTFVRMMTFFILGFILLGISFLYAYLEKTYGNELLE